MLNKKKERSPLQILDDIRAEIAALPKPGDTKEVRTFALIPRKVQDGEKTVTIWLRPYTKIQTYCCVKLPSKSVHYLEGKRVVHNTMQQYCSWMTFERKL